MKFLVFIDTLCRAEIKLGFAISTVKQSRKQTFSARSGIPSTVLSSFLNAIEGILVYDSFLCVGDNLPLVLGIENLLVYLVADDGAFEIHGTTRILPVL